MSQPVVVQTLPVIAYAGANAASKAITIPAGGVAGGHAVVLFVLSAFNYTGASDSIAVSDSRGNTYTRVASTPKFVTFYVHCYVALNITALQAGDTITITPFGATPWYDVVGYEVGALVTASALDVTAGTEQHDAGSANSKNTPDSGLTAATAAANELLLGAWGWDSLTTQITQTFTPTAGENWTGLTAANAMLQASGHEPGLWVAHKEPNATGTYKASGAFGTNVYALGALVVALKAVANQTPNAPALQQRPDFAAADTPRFSWTFSDDDPGDTQGSYQLVITNVTADTVTNGGFETNTTGWSAFQSTLATATTYAHSGTHSLGVTATAANFSAEWSTTVSGATAGQNWLAVGWVDVPAASNLIGKTLQVMVREAGGAQATFDHIVNYTLRAGPQRLTATGTLAQNDRTSVHAVFYVTGGASAGDVFYLDDAQLLGPSAATAFDSGQVSSANSFHDLTANTLTENASYQWKVRTWDNHAAVGPYATLGSFAVNPGPTPAITFPVADGDTVATPTLTVTWVQNGGDPQASFRVRLLTSGNAELWNSGQLAGAGMSQLIGLSLVSGTSYKLGVTVWDSAGRVSSEVLRTFSASFPTAVTPTLTVTAQGTSGRIHLAWTCPAPGGGQAATDHVDLFRAPHGTTTWTRIASGQAASGTYDDYTVPFGGAFDYKATAVTAIGATQDSATGSATVTCEVQDIWLHAVSNPAGTAARYLLRGQRASHRSAAVTLQRYEGRAFPVSEFDATAADGAVSVDLAMNSTTTDITTLRALYALRDTVCYRDNRGRKIFGVIPNLDEVDSDLAYSVALTLQRNDYQET